MTIVMREGPLLPGVGVTLGMGVGLLHVWHFALSSSSQASA